jgi:hypothetical protein
MEQCKHVNSKGKAEGARCPRKTKAGYCSKHQAYRPRQADAPPLQPAPNRTEALRSDPVFADEMASNSAAGPDKLKSSVYLLTINRNLSYDNMSTADRLKFKNFVDFLLSRDNFISNYVTDVSGDAAAVIDSVQIERHFEVGDRSRALHCHAYINIQHHGHISLSISDMKALARKIFNQNLYINVQATRDQGVSYLNYARGRDSAQAVKLE